MSKKLRGNFLPALTWNWLDVNDVEVDLRTKGKIPYTALKGVGQLDLQLKKEILDIDKGISAQVLKRNEEQSNLENYIVVEDRAEVYFKMPLSKKNPFLSDQNQIVVPALQNGTVVLYNYSEDETRVERNGTIYVDIANDAELNLVLVQRLNQKSSSNLAVMGRVADGAKINMTTVELGAGNTVFHYKVDLVGFASESQVHTAYLGSGNDKLDLFYHIHHIGEECLSNLQVNGALMDKALKKFRGTIDFSEGCSGSDGNEEEFCVLLDDTVHSISVPLLLAHEDDIVGNHAASAGKIDENQLFYLMSRGLGRKEAEGLIVESKMATTFDQIPDENLRDDLKREVHERILGR
ncbi:MAG TPA: SufD family Fe-S cluster assembly protein [Atopostipes sp.]|nr:SufD family Fe-S cluster assembly protein [Atopostipes sp.]